MAAFLLGKDEVSCFSIRVVAASANSRRDRLVSAANVRLMRAELDGLKRGLRLTLTHNGFGWDGTEPLPRQEIDTSDSESSALLCS